MTTRVAPATIGAVKICGPSAGLAAHTPTRAPMPPANGMSAGQNEIRSRGEAADTVVELLALLIDCP